MGIDPKLKEIYEQNEILEQTGGEDENKARKVISQLFKENEYREMGKRTFFMEKLDDRRKYNDYNKLCAEITLFYIEEENLPKSIRYKVQFDTKGVLLFVNVGRRVYQRAFRSVREPLYDLNACIVFAQSISTLLSHGRTTKPKQS